MVGIIELASSLIYFRPAIRNANLPAGRILTSLSGRKFTIKKAKTRTFLAVLGQETGFSIVEGMAGNAMGMPAWNSASMARRVNSLWTVYCFPGNVRAVNRI